MKAKNAIFLLTILLLQLAIVSSCKKDKTDQGIIPQKFSVDIPSSLSNNGTTSKSAVADSTGLNGNLIYANLNTFIFVGQSAAILAQDIMVAIAVYNINQPMELSYKSNDDQRMKNLKVIENAQFEGRQWQYKLTISDAGSIANSDSGKALQVFWNLNPTEGVAIIRPYNCDRVKNANSGNATFRIDYSEKPENGYDSHMIVQISGIPLPDASVDRYAINSLKMFVGKTGDIVDVYGNSNHPNAKFLTQDKGFNWAFVASSLVSKNIAVAEVGLPPSNLDETSRDVLLNYYSIKNVWTREIKYVWPNISDALLNTYLSNAEAPGYFSSHKFLQAGTSPGTDYDQIDSRRASMAPYNPKEISTLKLDFQ